MGSSGKPSGTLPSAILFVSVVRVFTLSLVDLAEPRLLAILFRSLFVTVLLFVGLGIVAVWLLSGADPCVWLSGESCELGLSASGLGALLITAVSIWLLFPAVALGVIAAYSDRIVAAVETLHYPTAALSARPIGAGRGMMLGLRSAGRLILYNLVALPFYLVLLITGVGTVILFVVVNGIAIGRDFGEMVSVRHGDATLRASWLQATRSERAAIGMIVTAIFLVPIVNLIAPLLGATMTTHLFHRGAARA